MTENEMLFWMQSISISLDISIKCILDVNELVKIYEDNPFSNIFPTYDLEKFLNKYSKASEEKVLYYTETPIKTCYLTLCLDKKSNKNIVIGPYVEKTITEEIIMGLKLDLNLSDSLLTEIKKYYTTLPIVDTQKLFALSSLFLEKYFEVKGPFPIINISNNNIRKNVFDLDADLNKVVSIKVIEERYQMENDLIDAVSKGDFTKAYIAYEKMFSNLTSYHKIHGDAYSSRGIIIVGVILRKAAEIGGVHPLYLDDISSKYTLLSLSNRNINEKIAVKMIKDYCQLVKEHSLKNVSPLVKRAITYINFNLNSDLNVSSIADSLCITPNYLYRLFKKECGMSVIEYINQSRINEALKLMKKTDMQIQMISEKVGINDISYFSRLFKKQTGKSPTKYKKDIGK